MIQLHQQVVVTNLCLSEPTCVCCENLPPVFHGIIWLKWGNFFLFYHFEGALCDQNLVQTHKHPGLPGHRLVMLFIYSFVICIYQLYIYCKFLFIRLFETFRQSAN